MNGFPKPAACACGALTVAAAAAPASVHACCCHQCQRRSGSAFTYTAFFAEGAVTIAGDYKTYRRNSDAGRFHETGFCPACGCAMFYRLEALPGIIGIPAGVFADASFPQPQSLYWTAQRHTWLHNWLTTPDGVTAVEHQ